MILKDSSAPRTSKEVGRECKKERFPSAGRPICPPTGQKRLSPQNRTQREVLRKKLPGLERDSEPSPPAPQPQSRSGHLAPQERSVLATTEQTTICVSQYPEQSVLSRCQMAGRRETAGAGTPARSLVSCGPGAWAPPDACRAARRGTREAPGFSRAASFSARGIFIYLLDVLFLK